MSSLALFLWFDFVRRNATFLRLKKYSHKKNIFVFLGELVNKVPVFIPTTDWDYHSATLSSIFGMAFNEAE